MEETIIMAIVVCILVLVLCLQLEVRNFNHKFNELLQHPHNHLICSVCGDMIETDLDIDKSLISTEKLQQDFDIKKIYIDFYGICPKCKKQG
jgi:Fur family transcriptional regulator, peroxide stress response regulator